MADPLTIVVDFNNPPWVKNKTFTVPFTPGAKIHDALLSAYDQYHPSDSEFTFDLRYSGKEHGYFVQSLCGVPTTVSTSWEIFIGDTPASAGIDTLLESAGEAVTFRYVLDRDELHGSAGAKRTGYAQSG